MSYLDAVILGLLQGLTEFLPVSSSGHLVLGQAILGAKQTGVSFEVLVHLSSLLAIVIYFRQRLILLFKSLFDRNMKSERVTVLALIIGTIPAVIVALLFKDFIEQAFSNPLVTSGMLFVTGAILLGTGFVKAGNRDVTVKTALLIGIGQAVAIMPGISRSGTTIATGIFSKIDPSRAAEFSFLLGIPAILGAVIFKSKDLVNIDSSLLLPYLLGAAVTFVASLFAVYAVLNLIRRGKFVYFGYYCFAAGALGLYLFL